MIFRPTSTSPTSRSVWLRRVPNLPGAWQDLTLSVIGNAAARETFVTATSHMAAIWTDLFHSMIAPGPELRWCGDGPGIGRDARIAYSSLLGRYMARAYLTEDQGVRVLVPLDEAKRRLQGTPYVIKKDPPSRGLEADWIGVDDDGLVIAEAKGSFDKGIKPWQGPNSRPQILQTAIDQAERTCVFDSRCGRRLPAKRWAIASRWGTEDNQRDPTLLAWDSEEEKLDEGDYRTLTNGLFKADVGGVMTGLGHADTQRMLDDETLSEPGTASLQIRVGDRALEPGFAAIVGPFGVQPLRSKNDILEIRPALDPNLMNLNIAVVSLSSRYVTTGSQEPLWHGEEDTADESSAKRAGLTVVRLEAGENIALEEE